MSETIERAITLGALRRAAKAASPEGSMHDGYIVRFHPSITADVEALPNFTPAKKYKLIGAETPDEIGAVERFKLVADAAIGDPRWVLEPYGSVTALPAAPDPSRYTMVDRVRLAVGSAFLEHGLDLDLMARAAIEAMREPTAAMQTAMAWENDGQTFSDADAMWRAGIDAALAEAPA